MNTLRATFRGVGPYRGVVKDGKDKIVAECEHWHRNRDVSSKFAGESAYSCAHRLLAELTAKADQ